MARHVEHKRTRMFRLLLTDAEYDWLRRVSAEEGTDMSNLIRQRVFNDRCAMHGDAIRPSAA